MVKVKSENKSVLGFKAKKRKNKCKPSLRVSSDASDQKYGCDECEYRTDCLGRLNAHRVCHSNNRPFVCEYDRCGQAFKRQNSLQRHVKALHLKERLYCCGICQKKFSQSQSLNDHVFIHLNNKSFKCLIDGCTKVFQTPKYLKAHQHRRHPTVTSSETSSEAKDINKSLEEMKSKALEQLNQSMAEQQKSSLSTNTNITNLSPVEPYRCVLNGCDYTCRLWRSLRTHYKFQHSDLYDKKTKTIDGHSLKTLRPKGTVSLSVSRQTIECHNDSEEKSIEIEISDNDISGDNVSHNEKSGDNSIVDKISSNSYFFECNFAKCHYRTKSFERIADHFGVHWQQLLKIS